MAITVDPAYNLSIQLMDRDRNTSTLGLHVPAAASLGAIETFVTGTVIPAVQGISNAVVKGWSITRGATDLSALADPEEASDVERKGVFSFRGASGAPFVVSVPSIINEVVIDRTNLINVGDALVVAFLDAVITGGTGASPSTYLGSDLIQLDHARKKHRGSSRG